MSDDTLAKLNEADQALTNLDADELGEAFDSAITAARASINSARAIAGQHSDPQSA